MATLQNPEITDGDMIGASKVNGTSVYNGAGEKIGSIDEVMLGKRSGRADYAIMSFGGFLGIGERYFPLPWNQLRYDVGLGGYVVDVDPARLEGAPSYDSSDYEVWPDEGWRRRVDDYYGVPGIGSRLP